jgi:hypothetical protein
VQVCEPSGAASQIREDVPGGDDPYFSNGYAKYIRKVTILHPVVLSHLTRWASGYRLLMNY